VEHYENIKKETINFVKEDICNKGECNNDKKIGHDTCFQDGTFSQFFEKDN